MKIRIATRQILTGALALVVLSLCFAGTFAGKGGLRAATGYPPLPSVSSTTSDGVYITYPASSTMDSQSTVTPVDSQIYSVHKFSLNGKMVNISFSVTTVPSSSPSMTPQVEESDDGGIT